MNTNNNTKHNCDNNPQHLLVCPFCYKQLALFSFFYFKGDIIFIIECQCQIQPRQLDLQSLMSRLLEPKTPEGSQCEQHPQTVFGVLYCYDCSQWICSQCENELHQHHTKLKYPTLLCGEHKEPFSYYCADHYQHFCRECIQCTEIGHKVFNFGDSSKLDIGNNYTAALKDYETYKQSIAILTQKITQQIEQSQNSNANDNRIQRLIQLKQEIAAALELTKQFIPFIQCLDNTVIESIDLPHINYRYLNRTINKKSSPIDLNSNDLLSLEDQCVVMRDYLRNPYTNVPYIYLMENSEISNIVFLFDGRLAAYSNTEQTVNIWNLNNLNCDLALTGKHELLFQLKDGRLLIQSTDKEIEVWDLNSYEVTGTITLDYWFFFLFEMRNSVLAFLSRDQIELYNLLTLQLITRVSTNIDTIYDTLLELNNEAEFILSNNEGIAILDKKMFKKKREIKRNVTLASAKVIQLQNGLLALVDNNGIQLWDINTSPNKMISQVEQSDIQSLMELPEGKFASLSLSKVLLWEVKSIECINKIGSFDCQYATLTLLDGDRLGIIDKEYLRLIDLKTLQETVKDFDYFFHMNEYCFCSKFNNKFAVGYRRMLKVYNIE